MVALKIRKVGNSLGVVLPKEVISRLRTGEGQDVFLVEGGVIGLVSKSSILCDVGAKEKGEFRGFFGRNSADSKTN